MSDEAESFRTGEVEGDLTVTRATGQAITVDLRTYCFNILGKSIGARH